jgi:hypothetical protein
MIDTILIFESKSEGIFSFVIFLFRRVTLPSHIKPQLATLSLKRVVILIKNDVNGFRNFNLSHNKILTTKTNYKNEISTKNWVGSTWVAKSQLWKKSKVNAGQSQRSTVQVRSRTDMALPEGDTCHCLTGRHVWHVKKTLDGVGTLGGA